MSEISSSKPNDETNPSIIAQKNPEAGQIGALPFWAGALVLLILGLLVFRDFVFGEKVLLYKETGSDSLNEYFPVFCHLSDYLRATGLPSWSFSVGMGQNLYYLVGYLLLDPVVWLPKATIPEALVFQHLAKTIVAGLLFLRFLQLRGACFQASLAGALLLSFSAFMCVGSCWIVFADEVVCFTFALFAIETAVRHGRWVFVTLAVALTSLITFFDLYLCAVLLSLYLPFRLIELFGWRPASLSRCCACLAAAALLGIGVAGITCFGNAHAMFESPRGSGTIATAWPTPAPFQLESAAHYLTAILRPFSNDILGTGKGFRGWSNYLEAPTNYCGLVCLIVLPQAFGGITRRQRILYGGFLCFVILPIVFPWLRHLFWLFQGGYYRALSLFSSFGVITLSMTTLSRYVEGLRLNLGGISATFLILLGILYAPATSIQSLADPHLRLMAVLFLGAYALVLTIGQLIKRQGAASWAVVALVALELVHFDRITVSSEPTVTKQELKQRVGYNDETADATKEIQAGDTSFFRIRKVYPSSPATDPSYNDAMVFGYYGTSAYSSFNGPNYIKFLLTVEAISEQNAVGESIWTRGLIALPLLSTFAGEKYLLTKDPEPFQASQYYEFVKRYGDIFLFRNRLFLPLGLIFVDYIPEDIFRQLPATEKSAALFHTAVVATDEAALAKEVRILTQGELTQRIAETPIPAAVELHRKFVLNIRSFSQTNIDGTVQLSAPGILVLQMPFDEGWHASINNQPATTLKVEGGLLGVPLTAGNHSVKLSYRPPLIVIGAVVSLLSVLLLAIALWKWPRIPALVSAEP